jgi:hypothetical protein
LPASGKRRAAGAGSGEKGRKGEGEKGRKGEREIRNPKSEIRDHEYVVPDLKPK